MTSSSTIHPKQWPITFRYVEVPHEGGITLGGIGLWYPSESEAEADFAHFHNYIKTPRNLPRLFKVTFESESDETYGLTIDISYPSAHYQISLSEIEGKYVTQLVNSLASLPYVFIIAGYTDEHGLQEVLPPSEYTFFISTLFVDGVQFRGSRTVEWPFDAFQSGTWRVIEEGVSESDAVN